MPWPGLLPMLRVRSWAQVKVCSAQRATYPRYADGLRMGCAPVADSPCRTRGEHCRSRCWSEGCTGLTARGRAQAEALAVRLRNEAEHFDVFYSSVLARAVETADVIAAARLTRTSGL